MKKLFLSLFIMFLITLFSSAQDRPLNILVVTGGHSFEHQQFFAMFDSFKGMTYREAPHPEADELLKSEEINNYDVLVFYDMPHKIDEDTKEAFIRLLENGKPMVFLHHSLASYPDWTEFTNIIGGKYFQKATPGHSASTYKHDLEVQVIIVNKNHPITRNMNDFVIHDEVYGNFLVLPRCTPLLKTTNPLSSPVIGWTNRYKNARIVYLQSGHDHMAYENPNFRKLVYRSILWVANKLR